MTLELIQHITYPNNQNIEIKVILGQQSHQKEMAVDLT